MKDTSTNTVADSETQILILFTHFIRFRLTVSRLRDLYDFAATTLKTCLFDPIHVIFWALLFKFISRFKAILGIILSNLTPFNNLL